MMVDRRAEKDSLLGEKTCLKKAGTYFLYLTKLARHIRVARHIEVARLTKLAEATLAAKLASATLLG
jgi:hypothetical protein